MKTGMMWIQLQCSKWREGGLLEIGSSLLRMW